MGRWDNSDRRERLPTNWGSIRENILDRDGHQCVWTFWLNGQLVRCKNKATDVDHKVPGDNHDPHNLQSLCQEHHAAKTARESGAARRAKRAEVKKMFRRPTERHPGLLP